MKRIEINQIILAIGFTNPWAMEQFCLRNYVEKDEKLSLMLPWSITQLQHLQWRPSYFRLWGWLKDGKIIFSTMSLCHAAQWIWPRITTVESFFLWGLLYVRVQSIWIVLNISAYIFSRCSYLQRLISPQPHNISKVDPGSGFLFCGLFHYVPYQWYHVVRCSVFEIKTLCGFQNFEDDLSKNALVAEHPVCQPKSPSVCPCSIAKKIEVWRLL